MTVSKLIFLDAETGGFDERTHPLIEIAWAIEDDPPRSLVLPHDVRQCNEVALQVNGYDERGLGNRKNWCRPSDLMALYSTLSDQTLVCSNPSFDERFLLALQDANPDSTPYKRGPWLHRKIDISSYAMPILGHARPVGLAGICEELIGIGADVSRPDHGAVNDVLALRSAFHALQRRPFGGTSR